MAFKYQQIAAELRARIEAGTYDGALPTEFAISEAFQASRQTVRRALALLVDD